MERLTEERQGQWCIPLRQDGQHLWSLCSAGMGGASTEYLYGEYADRLAAYEDTGLEPEEIEDLASVREITPEAEYAINKHADSLIERMDALLHQDDSELEAYRALGTIDHLRDLVQAEQDGRLVVPPCKVGDTVYLTYGDCVIEAEVTCIRPFVFKDKTEFRGNAAWRYEDPFYNDGRILEQDMFIVFGKTAFLTREEAEAALQEALKEGKR